MHDMLKGLLKIQFNSVSAALSMTASTLRTMQSYSFLPDAYKDMANQISASAELMDRFSKNYPKPKFGLNETEIDGHAVAVREKTAINKPFCKLKHFKRDTARKDPKVLLVAPMSGHYATLLRGTVEALLPDHEVYITDWKDARRVPESEGPFGLEDYIEYVQEFIRELGPDTHVMAVCQPTVPVLAAISLMAAKKDKNQPLSMTLIGGPIDPRAAETEVTKFAQKHSIQWFAQNLIARVPGTYEGSGRMVYPGFLQLLGFMSMNPDRHVQSHLDLFNHLRTGDDESADKVKEFYDEYLAVCDLPAEFYLDTVRLVFQEHALPRGAMTCRGETIDPAKIQRTALFTIEGALDDISAPGQTIATHLMCKGLHPDQKFNHLQEGAGHYGIFNGRRWREQIAPRFAGFIREIASRHGISYDPPKEKTAMPERWSPVQTSKYLFSLHFGSNDNKPEPNTPNHRFG